MDKITKELKKVRALYNKKIREQVKRDRLGMLDEDTQMSLESYSLGADSQ